MLPSELPNELWAVALTWLGSLSELDALCCVSKLLCVHGREALRRSSQLTEISEGDRFLRTRRLLVCCVSLERFRLIATSQEAETATELFRFPEERTDQDEPPTMDIDGALVSRTSPPFLEHLECHYASPAAVQLALGCAHSLTVLDLFGCQHLGDFLDPLLCQEITFPRLQVLRLGSGVDRTSSSFDMGSLVEVLPSLQVSDSSLCQCARSDGTALLGALNGLFACPDHSPVPLSVPPRR